MAAGREWSRREFLLGAVGGSAGLVAGGVLAACGGGDDAATPTSPTPTGGAGSTAPGPAPAGSTVPGTAPIAGTTAPARSGGLLRVAVVGGGTGDTLDPNNLLNTPDYVRSLCLFESLNFRDYEWQLFGLLAESIEMGATPDLWTIRLREGIEFHHGKTMTADDVVFSFQRVFNPESPGLAFGTLGAYLDPSRVTKIDDRTVAIELIKPFSALPQVMGVSIPVVPTDFDPANPVGTGPWKFAEFTPGDRSRFERFENYWDGPALTDELEIINFADGAAAANAIQAQQVDIIPGIDFTQKATLEAAGITVLTTQLDAWTPFVMNTTVAPFDDERVRQAFRLIVDREQMVQQVLSGFGRVANDLYAPTDWAYAADLPQRTQDIERAKALLAEAGYEGLTLDLASSPVDPAVPGMVQVFAEQAREAGVTINIKNMTPDQYFTTEYFQAPFQVDFYANSAYMVVTAIAQISTGVYNAGGFADPEFEALYEEVLAEVDEGRQRELLQQMQQIQHERGNLIVWGFSDGFDAVAPNVNGLTDNTKTVFNLNDYDLHRVWFS